MTDLDTRLSILEALLNDLKAHAASQSEGVQAMASALVQKVNCAQHLCVQVTAAEIATMCNEAADALDEKARRSPKDQKTIQVGDGVFTGPEAKRRAQFLRWTSERIPKDMTFVLHFEDVEALWMMGC